MIGKLFNERYEIMEKLGSGGTAIVYKGQDTLLGRMVTIKILREEYASNEDFVRRFRREAQAVASLSHGNIVAVYDVGFEENMHYIVMEFVEGLSLKEYIKKKGPLEVQEACMIMTQILDGIGYAHEHGIIHRDIKPHNILLGKDGRAKVTDFGIAVGMSDVTQTYNTSSRIMGSVHYIAPEQVQGQAVTEKSDLYSAGVVFYEMLTSKLPFNGGTPISIAMQHVQGELILPHQLNARIPIGLSYVVMRAMRKNPETRYDTAKEMMEAIKSVAEGLTSIYQPLPAEDLEGTRELAIQIVPGQDLEPLPRLAKPARRRRARASDLDTEVQEYEMKRKMKLNIPVVLISALVLILAFSVFWMIRQFGQTLDPEATASRVEVPDVLSLPEDTALYILEEEGLMNYEVVRKNDETIAYGVVMSVNPVVGTEVSPSRTIVLTVSDGPELTEVPNVVGDNEMMAQTKLNNRGLAFNYNTPENSEEYEEGFVIRQTPAAGTQVVGGTEVYITLSLGPEKQPVDVPTLTQRTLDEARAALEGAGLELGEITRQRSDEYVADIVIGQSVTAGTTVDEGTAVNLTVSEGPGPAASEPETPLSTWNVTYMLPNDGRNHNVRIVVEDTRGANTVYNQDHLPGVTFNWSVEYAGSATIRLFIDDVERQTIPVN